MEDRNLSWNVQQGYNSKGSDVTGSASANYKGRHGEYQLGYNYSRDNRQVSVGAMGGTGGSSVWRLRDSTSWRDNGVGEG
ncbi:fimbria/pilus outer membrane usher protein [Citrobacter amalonaticus]|nr:fimbria/pilus outer membrane usher protein [Citrobacter amalonaticus]